MSAQRVVVVYKADGRHLATIVDPPAGWVPRWPDGVASLEMPPAQFVPGVEQAFITTETKLDPGDGDRFVELDANGRVLRQLVLDPATPETAGLKRLSTYKRAERDKPAEIARKGGGI